MYYIGIDIGGTNIKAGIVTEDAKVLVKDKIRTGADRDYTEIVADMAALCNRLVEQSHLSWDDIDSIGIGSPGIVDGKNGVIVFAGNLSFRNAPIGAELKKHINKPVYMGNDANCAAVGEYIAAGKKDMECYVFVTLGTGVGGGAVINGKLFAGFNNVGMEVGHIAMHPGGSRVCTCGRRGCWETYASVTALVADTKKAIATHPDGMMAKLAEENGKIDGRIAFNAARAGDEDAVNLVNTWIENVAGGIVDLVNLLAPEQLSIGGAISNEGDFLLEPIRKIVKRDQFARNVPETEVVIASLGNDAGLIGAALLGKAQ